MYFVHNKVLLLHNNGLCILISKMSSKNIVIVVWMLLKCETWRKEIEFERLKIIDGCAHIFNSHKIHKCQRIKTLNADNGMEYCCSEWNEPLIVSFSRPMHVLSLFWVFIFQRWKWRNCKKKMSMKNPYLNSLMQIRKCTQNQPKYEY